MSASHILNKVLYGKDKVTIFDLWKIRKLSLNYLKVWGCLAYVRLPEIKQQKFGPKTIISAFVGYSQNSSAYRFLDLDSNVIIESGDADFIEVRFVLDKKSFKLENDT